MSDKHPENAAETRDDIAESAEVEAVGEVDETDAEAEIETVRAELAAQTDRLLRTVAEMDNLRKRTRREVVDSRRFAQADLLRPMLEVLDNFDRALAADAADETEIDSGRHEGFRTGVEMIAQSFRQVLQDHGVQPIVALDEPFDPASHEAVGQQPAPEGVASGTVMAVVQEGYTLGDMVLRASRVIVAQ